LIWRARASLGVFWTKEGATMIKRVLVALDGSDHAKRAMDLACEMASRFDAELIAVRVISGKSVSQATTIRLIGNHHLQK
jgi:nucleotide-binding universal stress UspA family protein